MKIHYARTISLADGDIGIWFGDYCWSAIFREGISVSKMQNIYDTVMPEAKWQIIMLNQRATHRP